MGEVAGSIRARARARGGPSLAEAVSAAGGVAVALGVLLITIDIRADNAGRFGEAALFAALVLAGYLVVALLAEVTHAAGVSAVALGIPGALGWLLLPGAKSIGDVRPFLVLTILSWIAAFVVPRTRGRTIFVAAAAVLLWLWILGEVAGNDAFSANPIPSPPAHTVFSLQAFSGARSKVELGDLDSSDPLYTFAQQCANGDSVACDVLYSAAPAGSDFRAFAQTCGNTRPDAADAGKCANGGPLSIGATPLPSSGAFGSLAGTTDNKSFDVGIVSAFFGVFYLGALFVLDRSGWRGLATAFVVPGFVALVTGTQALGNATHHAWAGGLLTMLAGLVIGLVGDRTGRRFTTWAGGVAIAFGALIVALDTAHISRSVRNGDTKLAGPGFIVMAFGFGLVAVAVVLGHFLRSEGDRAALAVTAPVAPAPERTGEASWPAPPAPPSEPPESLPPPPWPPRS